MVETIVLCHGSRTDFDEFHLEMTKDGCAYGRGFYFSNDMELGRQYSGGLDPYVAQITYEKPYVIDLDLPYGQRVGSRMFRPNKGARERLIEQGYDCVLIRQGDYVEMVVLHPEMIENYGRRADLDVFPASPGV
jgi:hypothetical protein